MLLDNRHDLRGLLLLLIGTILQFDFKSKLIDRLISNGEPGHAPGEAKQEEGAERANIERDGSDWVAFLVVCRFFGVLLLSWVLLLDGLMNVAILFTCCTYSVNVHILVSSQILRSIPTSSSDVSMSLLFLCKEESLVSLQLGYR